jgi:hypothetical protein
MTAEERIFDPRSGCLVAVLTALLTLIATVAAFASTFAALALCRADDCLDRLAWLLGFTQLAAPVAVLVGGVLVRVTGHWRWLGLGVALTAALIAADLLA